MLKKKLFLLGAAVTAVTQIMSIGASAAVELKEYEGRIDEIYMFNGGKYVYEGYKSEDQSSGSYFFNGEKDIEIEDAGAGERYGSNYINFSDDDILFNLLTGEIEDQDLEDKEEMMENKFRASVVKKAERYESTKNLTIEGKLNRNGIGEQWYEYKTTNSEGTKTFRGYISESGQYIDVSNFYNLIHYAKDENGEYVKNEKGKIEKITIVKASNLKEEGYKVSSSTTLFSDLEYIYKLVKIVSTKNEYDTNTYLLKVSKAQGKQNKEVFMPAQSICYEIPEDSGIESLLLSDNAEVKTVGQSLYLMIPENDEISVVKLDLNKVKEDGSKLDKRVVEIDEDYDEVENEDMLDYTLDVNGNLWFLAKGEVYKVLDSGKLELMYTCDRMMDRLSVYSDGNVAVWNTKNEVYAVIGGEVVSTDEENNDKNTSGEAVEEIADASTGWVKNEDETWSFIKEDNQKATGWIQDNGAWYFLNVEGIMHTGWLNDNGTWYYLNENGSMATGWFKDKDEKWYYLNTDGSMARETVINGYALGVDGSWQK